MDEYKNNIVLSYGHKKMVYNELTTKQLTSIKPNIEFVQEPNKLYTIIIVDPDTPSPESQAYKYHLHYLVVNSKQVINDYQGPNPPLNSGIHRYYTCVFEQDNEITGLNEFPRPKFNVKEFVRNNNINLIGCFKFRVKG